MVECSGVCGEWYHIKCVTTTIYRNKNWLCKNCTINYLFAMYSRYSHIIINKHFHSLYTYMYSYNSVMFMSTSIIIQTYESFISL